MNINILKLLNKEAKIWWYHQKLREQGQDETARQCERKSIKSSLLTIRSAFETEGAYIHIGKFGWSFHYALHSSLNGYGGDHGIIEAAKLAGVPIVDTRNLDLTKRLQYVQIGMVAVGHEPDPNENNWGSCAYVPLWEHITKARELGATIHNFGFVEN